MLIGRAQFVRTRLGRKQRGFTYIGLLFFIAIMGTVLGCLIIGVLNNGLFLLDVSPFWQQVVKGFVILAAVAIDKMSSRT